MDSESSSDCPKRNVLIHFKTREGKADGEPIASLFNEEAFQSIKFLKSEMKKVLYDVLSMDQDEEKETVILIDALYYVTKAKRNFPLVSIVNEAGIRQALKEYPQMQKNGHRSTTLLRFACDWHKKGEAVQTRSSPRNKVGQSNCESPNKEIPNYKIRIEVHAGVNLTKNTADGPIHTIYNVNSKENLTVIKKLVREKVPGACLRAGFFWLQPKNVKPLHTLHSDNDLETAKDAYRDDIMGFVKVLRLATVVESDGERIQKTKRSLVPSASNAGSKRSLECIPVDIDGDAEEFDDEAFTKFQKTVSGSKTTLKDNNAEWNKIHIELRKTLEERGQIKRFGIKHISLWTDLIQKGEVAGTREEPDWSKYKNIVDIEPIGRNSKVVATSKTPGMTPETGISDFLTAVLIQQEMERKSDRNQQNMFQAMLFQALSPRPISSASDSPSTSTTNTSLTSSSKGLMTKTCSEVCEILELLSLGQYATTFLEKSIDGATLSFITDDGLIELGIPSPLERSKILGYVAREKAG